MPIFTVLQQDAIILPNRLTKIYNDKFSLGGLFCSCFPIFIREGIINDALLIQKTAQCLDYYPHSNNDKKLAVLTGMYVYIWQSYEGNFQRLINKPFLDTLTLHLGVDSLHELDMAHYSNSLKELVEFCQWVYLNQKFSPLGELYRSFPADMQANIHRQSQQFPGNSESMNRISGFLGKLSIKGLF